MSDLLEFRDTIYRWIFEGILWIPVIAILGFILYFGVIILFGVLYFALRLAVWLAAIAVAGVGAALFYGTPIFAPVGIMYTDHLDWAVLWLVLSWIWLIGWFPAIYFLHFGKDAPKLRQKIGKWGDRFGKNLFGDNENFPF